ncbi:MAG: aquaporin [Anaerolineae bacterium]|nr:aquaporin [Anaerolineae bacterium]
MQEENWLGKYIGEAIGTYLIVLFGCGVVFTAIMLGTIGDLASAGIGWGLAVTVAVYAGATLSGAHFNPSVTLALAIRGRFPWKHTLQYVVAQILGAFLATATLFAMYSGVFYDFVAKNGITIGQQGSQIAMAIFVPLTPHPGIIGMDAAAYAKMSLVQGAIGEFLATFILMLGILFLLENRSINCPVSWFFPVALGLIVLELVIIEAPVSMLSLNAARDLGPRIFAYLLGFGSMAFPGPRGDIWVTTLVPVVGALAATYFYDWVMLPFFPKAKA